MPTGELSHIINTDIYLIDQILKGRYNGGGKLLDAGCGGRQKYFLVCFAAKL